MAGAEPLALLQAFRKSYWHLGITRILRGPVWLVDPLDDPRAAVVCRSIASRYRSRRLAFLSWLPELPDDPRSARLIEPQGLRRVVPGYSSAGLDLDRKSVVEGKSVAVRVDLVGGRYLNKKNH